MIVTLRQGMNPHGFFCLSSVGDGLSSGAWLRLGAYRSGGGKAERAHPSMRVLSWAVPCPLVLSCQTVRDRWPTTPVSGVLEQINTRIFRCCSPGNVPQRRRLFLGAIFGATALPKAVEWLPVPSQQQIARIVANTVAFLPTVLHGGTRTRFSCSRYYLSLLFVQAKNGHRGAKAAMRLTPWVLHRRGQASWLKPHPVTAFSSRLAKPAKRIR